MIYVIIYISINIFLFFNFFILCFSQVWDRRTLNETDPHPVGVLAGHMDGITYIDPRGDGRYLITNSKDQTIKLWDVRAFSDHNGEQNTRKAVANQNWDYRWQRVPKRCQ